MKEANRQPQLAIDIGNTATKAAVFQDGVLQEPVLRFTDDDWSAVDQMVTNHRVTNIILSTVANVPPAKWLDGWNTNGITVLELSATTPLPFTSIYETMETLGKDRIAAVAGSLGLPFTTAPARAPRTKSGSAPNPTARLIVDAGTCVTLDLIDQDLIYRGGNISPGVRMRLRAMHQQTARLPLVEPATTHYAVGRTTTTALRHGGQLGVVYEIEGLYARLREAYPKLELLLTGGDASLLSPALSVPHVVYPHLVLRGLHQILSNYVQYES